MVNPFHLHNWGNSLDISESPFRKILPNTRYRYLTHLLSIAYNKVAILGLAFHMLHVVLVQPY